LPEIKIEKNNENDIDENEDIKYSSLLNSNHMKKQVGCYIFLIDQSG